MIREVASTVVLGFRNAELCLGCCCLQCCSEKSVSHGGCTISMGFLCSIHAGLPAAHPPRLTGWGGRAFKGKEILKYPVFEVEEGISRRPTAKRGQTACPRFADRASKIRKLGLGLRLLVELGADSACRWPRQFLREPRDGRFVRCVLFCPCPSPSPQIVLVRVLSVCRCIRSQNFPSSLHQAGAGVGAGT